MKNWFNKNYKTLIIAAFLIPIITVAVVSISHVTTWYGLSNPVTWSVYLSIGIEIAALSALAAISANMGSKVYFPFAIVTIVQFIGNIFFAYTYIDTTSKSFLDWVDLVDPLVQFIGVESGDVVGHKRFLALFAGGMLPIISLSFLHMLVKFTEEDRNNNKPTIDDDVKEKENVVDAKDIISEVSRIRLSEEDLAILEKHLLNPTPPNEKLVEAAEKYKERKRREELLSKMMQDDEKLGLYDEPFENPLIKDEFSIETTLVNDEKESAPIENQETTLPTNDEITDWDVTLMDGLNEEENNFHEEPTIEEEEQNFSTITTENENIFQEEITPTEEVEEQIPDPTTINEIVVNEEEVLSPEPTTIKYEFESFTPEINVSVKEVTEEVIKTEQNTLPILENEEEKKNP
jgi:hypothetical protein